MAVTIKINPCPERYNSATPIQSGRTNSLAANDDGATQRGRLSNWTTLTFNNHFGNTNRFTGTTGGYHDGTGYVDVNGSATSKALAFPDDIVIDFSQWDLVTNDVIWWKFTPQSSVNWATMLSGIPYSHGGYSDWVVPNYPHEGLTILSFEINTSYPTTNDAGSFLNYPPFDRATVDEQFWTITPQVDNASRAYAFRTALQGVVPDLQTDTNPFFLMRYGNTSEL